MLISLPLIILDSDTVTTLGSYWPLVGDEFLLLYDQGNRNSFRMFLFIKNYEYR